MKVQIRSKAGRAQETVGEYVQRRLAFALGRFGDRIQGASVKLEDVNGPKGGADKQCSIRLSMKPTGRLQTASLDTDWFAAVDIAADRIGRMAARLLERERAFRFESGMVPRRGAWI